MLMENTGELAQNKLVLLYIINLSSKEFTNNEITEFVLEQNFMNFFLIQQYLLELIESNFIELISKDNEQVYRILEKGTVALSYFADRIPSIIKEDLHRVFNKINQDIKTNSQIIADYFQKENGQFVVNLKLIENEDTLFSLYLDVATKKQTEILCNKWKENPDYIYQNIINLLITEDNVQS